MKREIKQVIPCSGDWCVLFALRTENGDIGPWNWGILPAWGLVLFNSVDENLSYEQLEPLIDVWGVGSYEPPSMNDEVAVVSPCHWTAFERSLDSEELRLLAKSQPEVLVWLDSCKRRVS